MKSHIKRRLRTTQAVCLRGISGAYSSVPNETLCAITRIPPVHLQLMAIKCYIELKKEGRTRYLDHDIIAEELRYWTVVKLVIRNYMLQTWQEEWDNSDKGRCTYKLLPNLEQWINSCPRSLDRDTTLFLSSHCEMGVHLHRIGKQDSPNCLICEVPDSPAHRLMDCPIFEAARNEVQELLPIWIEDHPEANILNMGEQISNLREFLQEIPE